MKIFKEEFTSKYSVIIFLSLIVIIVFLLYLFVCDVLTGPKWSYIIPGLLTGFIIALFQAFLSWFELKTLDEYYELKIKKILLNRKDQNYYGNIIAKSKNEINIQGVTVYRFLDDFANQNTNVPEKEKVLLQALDRNVKVKILFADNKYLLNEDDKRKADSAKSKLEKLSKQKSIEYACYQHEPTHSIVIIDDECIVGPIFPNVSSKDTPAIHLKRDSQLAKFYEEYFNNEWEKWGQKEGKNLN